MTTVEQITNILQSLVSIPSTSGNSEACLKVIDYVENLFQASRYQIQRFEKNQVYSICISKSPTLSFDTVFLGHLDVVPGPVNIFTPKIENNWMFGRGTSDMKGSCATMIQLFLDNQDNPNFSEHALIFTTDEEVGGSNGVAHLIENCGLKCQTLFNPDGGGIFAPCLSQKGILHIELVAKGTSGHGSRPWLGDNAIGKLIEDIKKIEKLYQYADLDNPWRISMNLGRIAGGEATNSVPELARAFIDFRFPLPYTKESILRDITNTLSHSSVTELVSGHPVSITLENPVLERMFEAMELHGLERVTSRNHTGSDARWFVPNGATIILLQPNGTKGHIDTEGVDLKSLETLYLILQTFVNLALK